MYKSASSNVPDAPTPISSAGSPTQPYRNAAGGFDLHRSLKRKDKSRKDLDQPAGDIEPKRNGTLPQYQEGPLATGGSEQDDSTKRYFGDFSIESKRNARDLLKTHPMFDRKGNTQMNRIQNNTREVLPNDPTKIINNGGSVTYEDKPQASQRQY